MTTLREFMEETKMVDRWFVTKTFVAGTFAGSCLAVLFMWAAILS